MQIAQLQRTQIIRHVTEFFQHVGIAEIARGRVAGPAECNSPLVSLLPRQGFCSGHDRQQVQTFRCFASRDAVSSGDEAQRNVVSDVSHRTQPVYVLNRPLA